MRQFTDSEQVAMEKAWNKNFNDEPALSFYDSLEAGFIAGLDTAAEQIAALTAERNSLRAALVKATKDLKRMARDWRTYAAGDYCQTYNTGMADGLTRTADQLEDYVNDAWLALDNQT